MEPVLYSTESAARSAAAPRFAGLAGDQTGEPDGRAPLVFLHGLTFDRRTWGPMLAELARTDPTRQVLNLDLPGHGDSPFAPPHDVASVAAAVHDAVLAAGLDAPILVGHSVSAVVATIYAAHYPAAGVVNVDQSLEVAPFAGYLRSVAPALRGPDFAHAWRGFYASFHTELLPEEMAALVALTCRPDQETVLSYWAQILDGDPSAVQETVRLTLAELRDSRTPYLVVAGSVQQEAYLEWLAAALPVARVEVWPDCGHFPHLAHPQEFAALLGRDL